MSEEQIFLLLHSDICESFPRARASRDAGRPPLLSQRLGGPAAHAARPPRLLQRPLRARGAAVTAPAPLGAPRPRLPPPAGKLPPACCFPPSHPLPPPPRRPAVSCGMRPQFRERCPSPGDPSAPQSGLGAPGRAAASLDCV